MAYEIPQQLQHKEKIMFGLTFSQLVWVFLFGFIILIIFKKSHGLVEAICISSPFALVAILFIFFDVGQWIKYLTSYLKFKKVNLNSTEMEKLIEIKKVENDIIFSRKQIAILQVTPINFTIKTKEDKEAIIYGFQKFLNGLDFPVQFVVTTNKLDIKEYLDELQKRTTSELFADFSKFLEDTIKDNQIRNRYFYLVIPKKSDLEIQCKICKERLESLGLKVSRLKDRQILNNLYNFFNEATDKRKEEENISYSLHYLIAPNVIHDDITTIGINNKQCRIISAVGYPRMVESGFLDRIISSNDDFDISIHIEPFPIDSMMIMLNREIQKQRADLYAEEIKKSVNPSLEIKYKDTLKVLEELQKGTQKLFNVSLYINCKANTREDLDFLAKKVEAELNSIMIIPKVPIFRQIQGYKSMFPFAMDELRHKRNITTEALSAFFPFTSPFLTIENKGVMLGLNKNRVPYIRDIFGLSNANGIVLATSGSGKSYFTKLLIARQILNNTKVLIIDPQDEYIGLTGHCNGELITISKDSETMINPLDLMGHDYVEKRLALMDMFKIMFGDLSEIQKSILDRAINETYAKKGINAKSQNNDKKRPPKLSDLYKRLKIMEKKASAMEKVTYTAILNRLYMYTDGVFGFLNRQSNIQIKNNFVCFNIGNMPKQVKPLVMFLILDFVYMKMKESKEKKILVIDEAWSLLGKAEEASYIFEIVKTCRKYNLGLLLITQDVADLLDSKAGHAVLANSSYSLLLRQKPSVINSVVRTFNLSDMEREYLLCATQGRGILILDNEHQELEVVASPKEHNIITTNPNEMPKTETVSDYNKKDININIDLEKGLYYGSDLDIEQKNYLSNHGYKVGSFVPIGKPRQEECWVKCNELESIAHTFLVQNIKQEILKFTKEVETYITEKPDIIFKNKKGQEVAIEVETGDDFSKHKSRLIEKFQNVKQNYKNIVIVLTLKDYKRHYENITDIPVITRSDIQEFLDKQNKTRH